MGELLDSAFTRDSCIIRTPYDSHSRSPHFSLACSARPTTGPLHMQISVQVARFQQPSVQDPVASWAHVSLA